MMNIHASFTEIAPLSKETSLHTR